MHIFYLLKIHIVTQIRSLFSAYSNDTDHRHFFVANVELRIDLLEV